MTTFILLIFGKLSLMDMIPCLSLNCFPRKMSLLLLGANQTLALAVKNRKTAIELEASDRLAETLLQDIGRRKVDDVIEANGKQDGLNWQIRFEDLAVPSTRIGTRIEKVTLDIYAAETARLIRRYTTFVARHPQEE